MTGSDALSMRRLGAALERDPMVLYRHAPGRTALLDGVVEIVLAQLSVDPAAPDWTAQLRAVARDYRGLAVAHPTRSRCSSPGRWPRRSRSALAVPCVRSKTSSPCSPRRVQRT